MIRTQVYLTENQHQALRVAARREGVSMTELLRRLVDRQLLGKVRASDYTKDATMSLVGLGASGHPDISERHDDALDEALRGDAVR
jgi:hypothetical protein